MGFALTEAAYRLHLQLSRPHYFDGGGAVWYFERSPYRYSEEFGYEYVPGTTGGGVVLDGEVEDCFESLEEWAINARGNSGRIRGSYADAELKILVFGDSVTQRPRRSPDGEILNWPNLLQDRLERELGVDVHVVNFARDGYGVLQMLDLAAARVPEWRPDLAIVAFVSDDLTRARSWRTTVDRHGTERVLVSSAPDPDPGWDVATDAYLVHREATAAWCRRALRDPASGRDIARELEAAFLAGRRRAGLRVDPWSLRRSLVLDRIVHGDPFYGTYAQARPTPLPRHGLSDFAEDPRTRANLRRLETTGVPTLLVHLAWLDELAGHGEGPESERRAALLGSLARLAGSPIHATREHAPPVGDVRALAHRYPEDLHPSLRGHAFIADAVAGIVLSRGLP